MRDHVFSDLKDIQGEIMKRRVSFLLMLVLAFALALALSSCGECEHLNTEVTEEISESGNCRIPDVYEVITICADCGVELNVVEKKGTVGDHTPSATPVYENYDVKDCSKGGTCDEVIYCSVARCGAEISRKTVAVAATAHKKVTKTLSAKDHSGAAITAEYCTECAWQSVPTLPLADRNAAGVTHTHSASTEGVCSVCADVKSNEAILDCVDNGDGTLTLLGLKDGANAPAHLYIGYCGNKPITKIAAKAFENQGTIQALTMGECVEEVGADAFKNCSFINVITYNVECWAAIKFANPAANPLTFSVRFSVNNVDRLSDDIPAAGKTAAAKNTAFSTAGIPFINEYAFSGLKSNSIYIASETTEIAANAFAGCADLYNIYFEDTTARKIKAGAFNGCNSIRKVWASSVEGWLDNSFGDAKTNLLTVAGAVYFGNTQFTGGSLTIPAGVTKIPDYAFASSNITAVVFPASLEEIGAGAFSGCTAITKIDLPSAIETIGAKAFEGCSSVSSVDLKSVESIGADAFKGCTALTSVTIPAGLSLIPSGVFEGCSALATVNLGAGITEIAERAFYGCRAIAELDFSVIANLQKIGAGAFNGCSKVEVIDVPVTVVSIGLGAFAGCSSLEKIAVPIIGSNFGYFFGAETAAENRAFVPYSLNEVTINSQITMIAKEAFKGCEGIVEIYLPGTIENIYADAFEGCTCLEAVYFDGDVAAWSDINFANYLANPLANANDIYVKVEGAYTLLTVLEISADVSDYAFYGATCITSVKINGNDIKIGRDAFYGCTSLAEVEFTSVVEEIRIGARAFYGCTELNSVIVSSIENWNANIDAGDIVFGDALADPLCYGASLTERVPEEPSV